MPATATLPKKRVQTEVETSAEESTVVDPGLNKAIEEWSTSNDKAGKSWMKLAKYVRDKEITATQLRYALVEINGLKESTAKGEVSRLMRFQKSQAASDMLNRALKGEEGITVRDLQSASVKKGEKPTLDSTEVTERKLKSAARFAIVEAEMEQDEFISLARSTYKSIAAAIEAKLETNGEGEEDENRDEDEDEDEA